MGKELTNGLRNELIEDLRKLNSINNEIIASKDEMITNQKEYIELLKDYIEKLRIENTWKMRSIKL